MLWCCPRWSVEVVHGKVDEVSLVVLSVVAKVEVVPGRQYKVRVDVEVFLGVASVDVQHEGSRGAGTQ